MPEKIYAPLSVKEIETQYGPLLKLSFRADKMREFIEANKNAKGYVNLNVNRRKEVGEYGDTHYATLDTWEPRGQQAERQASEPEPEDEGDDNIPF